MNLYEYHSTPSLLDEYDNRITIIPELAYNYASETNQRFLAGERAVMKDPEWAYWYAIGIIKCRWEAAEPTIMKDSFYWTLYKKHIGIQE